MRDGGERARIDAQVLWLCVPDAAIANTAECIVAQRSDLTGRCCCIRVVRWTKRAGSCRASRRADRFRTSYDELSDATCGRIEGNTFRHRSGGRC